MTIASTVITPVPSTTPPDVNPNDNAHLSVSGMIETLLLSMAAFVFFMLVFESNRFYQQIYLKRLQNRFRVSLSSLEKP